jgi:predicted peptidase
MMKLTLVITIVVHSIAVTAQKRVISTDSFNKWPTLHSPFISQDGKYAAYFIRNNVNNMDSLIIQSTNSEWRTYAVNAGYPFFSDDSKSLYYTSSDNQVIAQSLGNSYQEKIGCIDVIKSQAPIQDWLFGSKIDEPTTLVAYNIRSRRSLKYNNIQRVHFTDNENAVFFERRDADNEISLAKLDISRNHISTIWQGNAVSSLVINNGKDMIAFIGEDAEIKKVFLYDVKNSYLKGVFVQDTSAKYGGLSLNGIQSFNGRSGLLLQLSKKPLLNLSNDSVKLNVWSYTDKRLQPLQLSELERPDEYTLYVDFKSGKYLHVSQGNEHLTLIDDECILVSYNNDTISTPSEKIAHTYYCVQLFNDAKRIKIPKTLHGEVNVSPDGKFLVYYNMTENSYYSYEVSTNTCRNITNAFQTEWSGNIEGIPRWIAGWCPSENAILIYDRFDIWKLDLLARKAPSNITNGFGKKHNIVFALAVDREDRSIVSDKTEFLLLAFNKKTKDNGFFFASTLKQENPRLASMGPYIYDISKFGRGIGIVGPGSNMLPLKAGKSDKYIVLRSSPNSHFNYYSTSDFKTFKQLSYIQPEKEFNWFTSELHTWKSVSGDSLQGILYKPENFDGNKKYPLVYLVYDDKSDGLNSYWTPDLAWNGVINIPYLVSHGYLVFAPDLMLKHGEIGKNLLDATLSSLDHLKKYQFIDSARIGIDGFSHGGFNTYFLITNTNKFAAAGTGGGIANLISEFGRIKGGRVNQDLGQTLLWGHTPWNSTKLVEYNSIFKVDRLQTPVLILHNQEDGAVNFPQAVEFYTAARSLGKRAWLLEYEGQGHGVDGPAGHDFTLRLMQFFDHYLKGKPAPLWMLEGRPARLRGIDDRLQLDTLGRTPEFSH